MWSILRVIVMFCCLNYFSYPTLFCMSTPKDKI